MGVTIQVSVSLTGCCQGTSGERQGQGFAAVREE